MWKGKINIIQPTLTSNNVYIIKLPSLLDKFYKYWMYVVIIHKGILHRIPALRIMVARLINFKNISCFAI